MSGAWGAGGRLSPGAVKPGGTGLGCWLRRKSKRGCRRRDDEVEWEVKARAPRFSKARARFSEANGWQTPGWRPLPYGDPLPLCPPPQPGGGGPCSLPLTRTWDPEETFSALLGCRDQILGEHKAGSAEVRAGRGSRPRVQACGCVHERGPGATHTHTHTLTRPHPRRALGRAARASPDLHPKVRSSRVPRPVPSPCRWLPTNAAGRIRGPGQGATAGSPHHPATAVPALPRPPREGDGEKVPGALTAPAAECARERPAGSAPPRRQGRRGRGRRAGREGATGAAGPAAPPRRRPRRSPAPACGPPRSPSAADAPRHPLRLGWEPPWEAWFLQVCAPPGGGLGVPRSSFLPLKAPGKPRRQFPREGIVQKFSKSLRCPDCAVNSFPLPCLRECNLT